MAFSSWRAFLREPLVQFAAAGGAVFAVSAVLPAPRAPPQRLAFTPDDVDAVARSWMLAHRSAPSNAELRGALEQRAIDEILFREGRKLALDETDPVIRTRVIRYMRAYLEATSPPSQPSDAELRTWFATNADRFARPGRMTFRHLFFSSDQRGGAAEAEARVVLARLRDRPAPEADDTNLGDEFVYPLQFEERPEAEVAGIFGRDFVAALKTVPLETWAGPLRSPRGWHVVWLARLFPADRPAFEASRDVVRDALMEELRAQRLSEQIAKLRASYAIDLPSLARPGAPPAR